MNEPVILLKAGLVFICGRGTFSHTHTVGAKRKGTGEDCFQHYKLLRLCSSTERMPLPDRYLIG